MRWFLNYKRKNVQALAAVEGLSPLERVLLGNRGLATKEEVQRYLHPRLDDLFDPFLFAQMEQAVEGIVDALSSDVSIRITGDYDQDGVAATAILVRGLRYLAAQQGVDPQQAVSYVIPNRMEDGYGLNCAMVDEAKREGVGLLITCDNGIAAFEALQYAKEQGIAVIVTDHHQIVEEDGEEKFPPALAILNPHSRTSGYPFADLCGAGVAFKLIEGLFAALGEPREAAAPLLQFAALGTICDMMPLVGENRTLVSLGLEQLNHSPNPGVQALLSCLRWEKEVNAYTVGFLIGPCINSSGRLFTARLGVELFLEDNEDDLAEYARQLVDLNEERKAMMKDGVEQAISLLDDRTTALPSIVMLYLPEVHESVCGLIAGRVKERTGRPTLVFTDAQEEVEPLLKGSGRSIPAYSMFEKLNAHRKEYVAFGGHAMACGMTIRKADFERLRTLFESEADLDAKDFEPELELDCPLDLRRLDFQVIDLIEQLEPFGIGNPKPRFGEKNLHVRAMRLVGKSQNVLQIALEKEGRRVQGVLFRAEETVEMLRREASSETEALLSGRSANLNLDIVYSPERNEYNGRSSLQLILEDVRISA